MLLLLRLLFFFIIGTSTLSALARLLVTLEVFTNELVKLVSVDAGAENCSNSHQNLDVLLLAAQLGGAT